MGDWGEGTASLSFFPPPFFRSQLSEHLDRLMIHLTDHRTIRSSISVWSRGCLLTRRTTEALLGGGGMHVPRLNFKSCHVAILKGPYVAVGISFTAAPKF